MLTLSLCLIARDEEQNLERCLQSVQGLADEIIVVDTGSADKTKEIARRFTEQVFDFPWNNDFAAAKNEAVKRARSDWILVLDADEVLARSDHPAIKAALQDKEAIAFTLILRNYINDSRAAGWLSREGDGYEESKMAYGWWEVSKIRLFRNHLGIQYQGRIHESVYPSLQEKLQKKIPENLPGKWKVLALPIPIHHYGHLDPQRQAHKRSIYEQLQKEKVRVEEDYYNYFELARQLLNNHKWEEAQQALDKSIQHNGQYFQSWFLRGTIYLLQEKWDEALAALERAQDLNPAFGATYTNLGIVYAKKKFFQQAIEQFLQALELNPKDATAWKNVGMCFDGSGDKEKAYRAFKRAVELNPAYAQEIKFS